jgi:hypothetical protein
MYGNGQDPGRTQRSPATAYLLVDSFDRHQSAEWNDPTLPVNQPINNFTISKRQPFLSGFFNRLGLTEVRFPYMIPNINERNNKIEVVDATSANVVITIPEGYYTPDELATELDNQLTAGITGQTWAVTYEEEEAIFQIVSNGTFTLLPYDYGTANRTRKGLFYMMNGILSSPSTTYVTAPGPSLQYTTYIDICSRALTQFQQVKDNSSRENQAQCVVTRLFLVNYQSNENLGDGGSGAKLSWPGCRPQMVYRDFANPKQSAWQPGQFIDAIDIALYDDAGDLLYYPANSINTTTNDFQLNFLASEN